MKKLLIFLFTAVYFSAFGQDADTTGGGSTLFGLPLVFYSPETRWGFGAAGFYSFRFKGEPPNSRPSQIQLGGAYTLEDQILSYLPFQLWWDDEKYSVFGELGWYRYNYFFYGIGNDASQADEELYGVNYPRLRATFMRAIFDNFYVGVRAIADDFDITETDTEGALSRGIITGSKDGLNAGAGILVNYDSRDNYFESHNGWYAEFTIDRHGAYLGSDFEYTRFRLDVRKFLELAPNDHLALNFFSESIQGDAPFISLALIGGTKRMRGYYEGRYRDDNSAIFQMEYRRQLFGRFGAVAFAGTGAVADQYGDLSTGQPRLAYGAGLRFALSKEDRINIRFDVGLTEEQTAFYLTIGESF